MTLVFEKLATKTLELEPKTPGERGQRLLDKGTPWLAGALV